MRAMMSKRAAQILKSGQPYYLVEVGKRNSENAEIYVKRGSLLKAMPAQAEANSSPNPTQDHPQDYSI